MMEYELRDNGKMEDWIDGEKECYRHNKPLWGYQRNRAVSGNILKMVIKRKKRETFIVG